MRLENKTALITGATGELGKEVAARFAKEGAKLALVAGSQAKLDALMQGFDPALTLGLIADVRKSAEVAAYAAAAHDRFGPIDIFFNNAGIEGPMAPIGNYPEDGWDDVMAVNVNGAFYGLKYVLPRMRDGGSVVITSSVAGLSGSPNFIAYSASKHAVVGLVRTAALEVASRKIRVNCLHPAMVEGEMIHRIEQSIDQASGKSVAHQMLLSKVPLGRYLQAGDVADAMLFLASDESRMITGTSFVVDGGFTI